MFLEIKTNATSASPSPSMLPNPFTPKAFMPANVGAFITFDEYTVVGSFSILVWDIVNSARQDFELLSTRRITFMTTVFLVSRISALLAELFSVLLFTYPLGNCTLYRSLPNTFYFLYRVSTNTLFYARVQAVYHDRPIFLWVFRFLWLIAAGGACLGFFSSKVSPLSTGYCTFQANGFSWLVIIPVSDGLFDLLVCVAVTYGIGSGRLHDPRRRFWQRWLGWGQGYITRMSDRFLRDNQLYVSLVACVKLPEVVIIIASIAVPSLTSLRIALAFPDMTLTSILATRIYRNMKLGGKGLASFETTDRGPSFIEWTEVTP
ncbi:hypothetical protein CPB83DRAFT_853453 [Crepidotus variabilis]|uniref:Uncharacterized protein n=1 Tax=Crepidotus variabilis TaxID=179855 RepID=A0A9P6JQN6_9AGAR|nr:hypothetical protein CPB83DRAFT_853453 [Crepidotus variabilis]